MLPIEWLASAQDDLAAIIEFIANDNPMAALRLRIRLEESVLPVSEHPYLFRRSLRLAGLREIVAHPNYVVFYRVMPERIEVVNVAHTRQQFPKP